MRARAIGVGARSMLMARRPGLKQSSDWSATPHECLGVLRPRAVRLGSADELLPGCHYLVHGGLGGRLRVHADEGLRTAEADQQP